MFSSFVHYYSSDEEMKIIFAILVVSVVCCLSKTLALLPPPDCKKPGPCTPPCPECNPLAGCHVGGCPCTHDGFIMYPGRHPLNPIRPKGCPKCVSKCPLNAIFCAQSYHDMHQCTAQQISAYKCIEEIQFEKKIVT